MSRTKYSRYIIVAFERGNTSVDMDRQALSLSSSAQERQTSSNYGWRTHMAPLLRMRLSGEMMTILWRAYINHMLVTCGEPGNGKLFGRTGIKS